MRGFKKTKILPILIYALPILFFIVSYFLITTSGEDIHQGAGNFRLTENLNPLGDAINAFNYNSRVTDTYAWSVIDFYDYQFRFGPDLIFRLVDTILAIAVFYFATYIILNRKPKLTLKDSCIFSACFLFFIITPFGRNFYLEFSMIHNYVPLALITVLFAIPYLKLALKTPTQKYSKLLNFTLPLLGLYFGMAATITPLAFLLTIIIYCIINRKNLSRLPLWFYTGLLGLISGFLICFLLGSGVSHYISTQSATFDYLPLSSLFTSPIEFIMKISKHLIYNFGIVLLPLLALFIFFYIFTKPKINFKKLDQKTKNFILIFSIFIIIHLLGTSLIKAPFRLLIPAYLAGTILVLKIFQNFTRRKFINAIIISSSFLVLIVHSALLIKYHCKAAEILTEIKNSPETTLCIDEQKTKPTRLRFIDLSQANFLVDWGYPEVIYGKNITFCK